MLTAWMLVIAMAITPAPTEHVLAARTEAQRVALSAKEREICFTARKFVGKSWACCVSVLHYCLEHPGARGLICREERASMDNTTLAVLWEVLPPDWKTRCWRISDSMLQLPNGSEIHVDGFDKPERMQGSRYGIAACDQAEDLSYHQFEILNGCVGQHATKHGPLPYRKLILAFNPSNTAHWAYRRYQPDLGDGVREIPGKAGVTKARVVHARPGDLADLMPDDYKAALSSYHGVFFRRMVLGQWCSAEGQVYSGWEPAKHIVAVPALWGAWGNYPPPDWDRIRAIDFGMDHPWACGWMALEPGGGAAYVYRQCYMSGLSPRQQAQTINTLEAAELKALREVCDPDQAQAQMTYLEQLNIAESWSDHDRGERATYAEEGVWTEAADKDVLAGIGTVTDWLARDRLFVVQGSLVERDQRLVTLGVPTCLEEEMPAYSWPRADEDGGMKPKETPVKKHDHALDWLRYGLHSHAGARKVAVYA